MMCPIDSRRHRPLLLLALTLALLMIATPRVRFLPGLRLEIDEVWSIWQTFGSPTQIINWTPYDWPPLYYLSLGLWKGLVGIHPLAVRMLSIFAAMLGGAFLYRAARRFTGREVAALLALVMYATLQFSIYISTMIRGYIFLTALTPLAFWLTMRYFERPSLRRALWLALTMVAMWYSHLTAILVFAVLGLYSLILCPRQIWRWLPVGVIAIPLAVPEIINKIQITIVRVGATQRIQLPPLLQALAGMFEVYTRPLTIVWAALCIGALGLLVMYVLCARQVPPPNPSGNVPRKAVFLGVWVLSLIVIYFLNPVLGFFLDRHLSWVIIGLAILVGWGLSRLPRPAILATAGMMVIAGLWPMPEGARIYSAPFDDNFAWLRTHMRPGDVVLIDPNCNTAEPEEWDYFTQVYFPAGLDVVTRPGDHRRIWYVTIDGREDPAMKAAVLEKRAPGEYVGPWHFLIRLYEAPPDVQGVLYENGMRFHGAEIVNGASPGYPVYREAETVRLKMWWSVDDGSPVTLDYSITTQVPSRDGTSLIAQVDGPPQVGPELPAETSRWTPGQFYVEEREFALPEPLLTGVYRVNMAVYWWQDQKRLNAPGVNADGMREIAIFRVKSW